MSDFKLGVSRAPRGHTIRQWRLPLPRSLVDSTGIPLTALRLRLWVVCVGHPHRIDLHKHGCRGESFFKGRALGSSFVSLLTRCSNLHGKVDPRGPVTLDDDEGTVDRRLGVIDLI